MKFKIDHTKEINVPKILAEMSDKGQASFFNNFFEELEKACGSRQKAEMQICHMSAHLNERTKNAIFILANFNRVDEKCQLVFN